MVNYVFILILSNAILVGVILMTQFLSYPLFRKLYIPSFSDYYKSYTNRISLVVIPLMVTELVLSIFLFWLHLNNIYVILSSLMLIGVWLSTFFLQVPLHNQLSLSYDKRLVNKLIKTNWIRTILWCSKCFILSVYYLNI